MFKYIINIYDVNRVYKSNTKTFTLELIRKYTNKNVVIKWRVKNDINYITIRKLRVGKDKGKKWVRYE